MRQLLLLVLLFLLSFLFLLTGGSFYQGGTKELTSPGAQPRGRGGVGPQVGEGPAGEARGAGAAVEPGGAVSQQGTGEICIQSKKCKSRCCRREPKNCESYCALKGSEGSACHTQTFLGLYNECPCLPDLTCVFPKNEKSFRIIYGRCKKTEKKKPAKKSFF
ncbi:PREDICTED: colipase-like protein 1 [Ceratotherium simum simum]|uniref:Colipase-like protein 1 n=1 Tax=Ceratotherium simum simum TaxID=73337 RepID=A0ABM1CES2_CERSS|nr:PREDICTED: colipase-like protein 1 [Ceratotherium simum simum]